MDVTRGAARVTTLVMSSVATLACSALVSCGSTAGARTEVSPLCGSAGRVDRLVAERINRFPRNHEHFTFPAKTTVSDPAQAQSVALTVCALPPMPSGTFSCPADFGIVYRLTFTAAAKTFPPVRAEATGCNEVYGAGQIRWTARSPGFWQTLATAMGLKSLNNSTFSGTIS